jgi:hypothetical protein
MEVDEWKPTATSTIVATAIATATAATVQAIQATTEKTSVSGTWPWLDGVAIPYMALLTLAIIEGGGGWPSLRRKFFELGIDACILGIGVCGALFGHDHIHATLGGHAATVAILAIFVELALTGICLNLRTENPSQGRVAASLFLGTLILGLNSVIIFHYS